RNVAQGARLGACCGTTLGGLHGFPGSDGCLRAERPGELLPQGPGHAGPAHAAAEALLAHGRVAVVSDARASGDVGTRPALDFVSAHGTATLFNDLMESHALALALGRAAPSVPLHSIKASLGHTLGAAGALEAVVCVRTLETGQLPPTAGLLEQDPEIHLDVV